MFWTAELGELKSESPADYLTVVRWSNIEIKKLVKYRRKGADRYGEVCNDALVVLSRQGVAYQIRHHAGKLGKSDEIGWLMS